MARTPDSDHWDQLVDSIKRGTCVVMLGQDALTARYDRASDPEPFRTAFARHLRTQLEEDQGVIAPADEEASTLAERAVKLPDGRDQLLDWVRSFYARQEGFIDPTIQKLSEIPVGVLVNTVPGLRLEHTFEDAGSTTRPAVAIYDRNGPKDRLIPDWDHDDPLIYHLYGSIDEPSSLALTDTDLLDVLVSVVGGEPGLPENLLSRLADAKGETTYLFLGFRLYTWQHRVLMRVLDEAMGPVRRKNHSFAFETDQIFDQTRSFFAVPHKIRFFDTAPLALVTELSRRISGSRDERVPERAPDPEKIFICHASEDHETALELADRLREQGLTPWIDRDDIRGGDRWDALIMRTLEKEVSYIVMLRSRHFALKARQESYVTKEIKIALRRNEGIPDTVKFIIPMFIDDDRTRHDDLDDEFHWIDYEPPNRVEGLRKLVSVIRKDIQERRLLG